MVNVFLADTRPEERSALRLLVSDMKMKVVGEAADWITTLSKAPSTNLDLLLVDWDLLPDEPTTAISKLRSACSSSISIVLLSHLNPKQQAAQSAGADLFISKGETPTRVAEGIKWIAGNIDRENSFTNIFNLIGERKDGVKMDIKVPQALVKDHEEIDSMMERAIQEGGKVSEAAKILSAAVKAHITHEEKFALPPLGLLPDLVNGRLEDEMDVASEMADDLRSEMPQMLAEHKKINLALDDLDKAAAEENKPVYNEFVDWMKLHLLEEEQVYYPSALLVGLYLKFKLAALVQFRYP